MKGFAEFITGDDLIVNLLLIVDESIEDLLAVLGESAGVTDTEESEGNSISFKVEGIDDAIVSGSFAGTLGGLSEQGEVLILGVIDELIEDLDFF
jgi:hypothetical protein